MFDLLVDIDVDFFYGPPVYHRGVLNPGQFKAWISPQDFLSRLSAAKIELPPLAAVGMADHREAYFCWKKAGLRRATVLHFDAHSDCYHSLPEIVHCGNFLLKAIKQGLVGRVIWVVPSWFYDNPHHPTAEDAFRSVAGGMYRGLPLEMRPFAELPIFNITPTMATLSSSPSYVPYSAFADHFVPLARALGIDHSSVPSAA